MSDSGQGHGRNRHPRGSDRSGRRGHGGRHDRYPPHREERPYGYENSNVGYYGRQPSSRYTEEHERSNYYGPPRPPDSGRVDPRSDYSTRGRGYYRGGPPLGAGRYNNGPNASRFNVGRGGRDVLSREMRGGQFGGRGRGGRVDKPPDMSHITEVRTNIIPTLVSKTFVFYQYCLAFVDGDDKPVLQRFRKRQLWLLGLDDLLRPLLAEKALKDLKRLIFFTGSCAFSARPIPGLEENNLPKVMYTNKGDKLTCVEANMFKAPLDLGPSQLKDGESDALSVDPYRCATCSSTFDSTEKLAQHCSSSSHALMYTNSAGNEATLTPAPPNLFVSYANHVLQDALGHCATGSLNRVRLIRWGRSFIDPDPATVRTPRDRSGRPLGVSVFPSYRCNFGLTQTEGTGRARLSLTVDLGARVIRTKSLIHDIHGDNPERAGRLSESDIEAANEKFVGQTVIRLSEWKGYVIRSLVWESPEMIPIPDKGISHSQYYLDKKRPLVYPDLPPMVEVEGRGGTSIYLPAEQVAWDELDPYVRQELPKIASYRPSERHRAIEVVKSLLMPGSDTNDRKPILPAAGIYLEDDLLSANAKVLRVPKLLAMGFEVPHHATSNWAKTLSNAKFNVDPNQQVILNTVVICDNKVEWSGVYSDLRKFVGNYDARFRLSDKPVIKHSSGDSARAVEEFLTNEQSEKENLFLMNFVKPGGKSTLDPAYNEVKAIVFRSGHLSQYLNFNVMPHDNMRKGDKAIGKSVMILQAVARQILQKAGARIWWVEIPRSLPLPALFVGVDIFHSPPKYYPELKRRVRKYSCTAVIVELIRNNDEITRTNVEICSNAYKTKPGSESNLGPLIGKSVSEALLHLKVNPKSVVVWRDGIGDSAFEVDVDDEIAAVREAIGNDTALAYMVCQKRIGTKFFNKNVPGSADGEWAAPPGTLVEGLQKDTFYIQGRAPPESCAKPCRVIVAVKDEDLANLSLADLTWGQCHAYPNWTGAIKVPSQCQMAHKLAEMLGMTSSKTDIAIDVQHLKNRVFFL